MPKIHYFEEVITMGTCLHIYFTVMPKGVLFLYLSSILFFINSIQVPEFPEKPFHTKNLAYFTNQEMFLFLDLVSQLRIFIVNL